MLSRRRHLKDWSPITVERDHLDPAESSRVHLFSARRWQLISTSLPAPGRFRDRPRPGSPAVFLAGRQLVLQARKPTGTPGNPSEPVSVGGPNNEVVETPGRPRGFQPPRGRL